MACVIPWTGEVDVLADDDGGGFPTWRYGTVPKRHGLATRRQLRALGLSIGRQYVAGRVSWEPRRGPRGAKVRYGNLYRIDLAKPRREHTAAAEEARLRAMLARRTCHVVGHQGPRDVGYCVPRCSLGGCVECWEAGRCVGSQGPAPVVELADAA